MKNFGLQILRVVVLGAMLCRATSVVAADASAAGDPSLQLLKNAAWMLLKEGNARFVGGKSQHPNQDGERRVGTAVNGQEPFVTILACSDSRDPVELIFDRGVGDLFVARVAGNVAGLSETATVEYGVAHLNTPLLVVMGHSGCGAVGAVVKGAELHGHLVQLAQKIEPAVRKAKAENPNPDDLMAKAVEANVWQTIADLVRSSEIVQQKVQAGSLEIVGAVYDLKSGRVAWLGTHPEMEQLLATDSQIAGSTGHPSAARPQGAPATAESSVPAQNVPASSIRNVSILPRPTPVVARERKTREQPAH